MQAVMQPYDLAVPILPSRSIVETVAFYERLGFEGGPHECDSSYAIFRRGSIELHFFSHPELNPSESFAGAYLRVRDVEEIYQVCLAAQLPRTGIPRLERLEDKPWGLKEFAIVDIDGTLLRIAQIIDE